MLARIRSFFDQQLAPSPKPEAQRLQLAAAALLLETSRADHDVAAIEVTAIANAIKSAFSLSEAQTTELLQLAEAQVAHQTSYFGLTSLIKEHYDYEMRVQLIELMWFVALADGRLDVYEEHLIRKIAGLLYVRREDIVAAKQRARRSP